MVYRDATASLSSIGILGEKYIVLDPGHPEAGTLPADAVIPSKTAFGLDNLMETVGGDRQGRQEHHRAMNESIGGEQGREKLDEIVDNIRQLTGEFRAMAQENHGAINATMANVQQMSTDLKEKLPRIAQQFEDLGRNLNEHGRTRAGPQIQGLLTDVRKLTASLQATADNVSCHHRQDEQGRRHHRQAAQRRRHGGEDQHGRGQRQRHAGRVQVHGPGPGHGRRPVDPPQRLHGRHRLQPGAGPRPLVRPRLQLHPRRQDLGSTTSSSVNGVLDPGHHHRDHRARPSPSPASSPSAWPSTTCSPPASWRARAASAPSTARWTTGFRLGVLGYDFTKESYKPNPRYRITGSYQFYKGIYGQAGLQDLANPALRTFFFGGGLRWTDEDLKKLVGLASVGNDRAMIALGPPPPARAHEPDRLSLPAENCRAFLLVRRGVPLLGALLLLALAALEPAGRGWYLLGAVALLAEVRPSFHARRASLRSRGPPSCAGTASGPGPCAPGPLAAPGRTPGSCPSAPGTTAGCARRFRQRKAGAGPGAAAPLHPAGPVQGRRAAGPGQLLRVRPVHRGRPAARCSWSRGWDSRITNRSHKAYREAREYRPDLIVAVACADRLLKGLAKAARDAFLRDPPGTAPRHVRGHPASTCPTSWPPWTPWWSPEAAPGAGGAPAAGRDRLMRTGSRLRRACERVVGPELTAYLLHLRPMEWPIMTAHFLLGTLLAVGLRLPPRADPAGLGRVRGAAQRRHPGHQQRLRPGRGRYRLPAPSRPSRPGTCCAVSALMLAAALGLGFLLPPLFAWSNAACVAMAVLYSVPPARLKARAGWDLLINCLGLRAAHARWRAGASPAGPCRRGCCAVAIGFGFLFGALYPPTQVYQIDEDRARGDRTLVIVLGEGPSLALRLGPGRAGPPVLRRGARAHGRRRCRCCWSPWPPGSAVLLPWWARWRQWTPARHQHGMYWTLGPGRSPI